MVSLDEDFEEGMWPFGGEGDADEVPVPVGASCVKISEILLSADEKAGEYSFGGMADGLTFAPGLFVDGVGAISFPLVPEQAEKLIAKCEKSPFGHNMDTKMDDNVRKSWQLATGLVHFNNSHWTSGIKELTGTVAQRLGYENTPLNCVLYKLLIYGKGGHFVKHQDTEKKDGMIATLVVQPPSTHEGGDLVVFRGGKERYRHDFGKTEGTASYLTHYAVHYADAVHSLEKVTKGYRLVLVYSICLPMAMRQLKKDSDMPMSDDLADAVSDMELNHESFALRLSHEYTKKSIEKMGSGALKGIDSARFRALEEANAVVPVGKKLQIFIAKISHKIVSAPSSAIGGGWQEEERSQTIHWYSASGKDLGRSRYMDVTTAAQLNFLNPGQETFAQLWEAFGDSKEEPYTGNEALLDILGNMTDEYLEEEEEEEGDGVTHLEMTLQVLDGLEGGPAQQALLNMAVELVVKPGSEDSKQEDTQGDLNSPNAIGILWKHVIQSSAKEPFDVMINHIMLKDPSELGQTIEVFSQYAADLGETSEKFMVLASIAAKRAKWLKREIRVLDKPFSWEMPDANFPDNKSIEDFLRGSGISMNTEGLTFCGLPDARKYAATCVREKQDDASFTMKPAGKGKKAFVTITKTRKWFNNCQKELVQHRAELDELQKLYKDTATGSQKKKCRRE
ncbi:hypothetical protein JG688_00016467 [Phytophthora aleatoria]|uniref:Fe2OG dioxygenase domain-containing protein n=1 Tax=Phytophthora aleatoria TaxID=2496075 RepID=A0A8J5IRZ7_9STRA|nr:hypothetical protein JG688_00016467 [Phytophthora aleatoria]